MIPRGRTGHRALQQRVRAAAHLWYKAPVLIETFPPGPLGCNKLLPIQAALIGCPLPEICEPLDDGTRVVTGHGPATTIGEERHKNPFVRG